MTGFRTWILGAVACLAGVFANACAAQVLDMGYWAERPLPGAIEDRITAPPAAVMEYLRQQNLKDGFPQVPRAAVLDPAFAADLRLAVATMPEALKRLVGAKLLGLFPVRDLGSTGLSEMAFDKDRRPRAGFVVVDVGALDTTANAWMSWRESTPFIARSGHAVRARIADPQDDDRVTATRYILLHEFAHILAIGEPYLPLWDTNAPRAADPCKYEFLCLSWSSHGGGPAVSRFDRQFPDRARITYYLPSLYRMDIRRAPDYYRKLASTDFVSPYASLNPFDDFAEGLASFVHNRLMGRPFALEVIQNGAVAARIGPCWDQPRCAAKRRFFETLLGSK